MFDRVKLKLRIHEAKLLHQAVKNSTLISQHLSRQDREIIFRLQKRFITFENNIMTAERRRANKSRQNVKAKGPVHVSTWLELWEAETMQRATSVLMARTTVFTTQEYPALMLMFNEIKSLAQ